MDSSSASWLCPACLTKAPSGHSILSISQSAALARHFRQYADQPINIRSFANAHSINQSTSQSNNHLIQALELMSRSDCSKTQLNRRCIALGFDPSLVQFVALHAEAPAIKQTANQSINYSTRDEVSKVIIHADDEHEDTVAPMPIIQSRSFSSFNQINQTPNQAVYHLSSQSNAQSNVKFTSHHSPVLNASQSPPIVPVDLLSQSPNAYNSQSSGHPQSTSQSIVHPTIHAQKLPPPLPTVVSSPTNHDRIDQSNQQASNQFSNHLSSQYAGPPPLQTNSPSVNQLDSSDDIVTIVSDDHPALSPTGSIMSSNQSSTLSNNQSTNHSTNQPHTSSPRSPLKPPYYSQTMRTTSEPTKSKVHPSNNQSNSHSTNQSGTQASKPKKSSHHSRYSIVGLPRPRRLAVESNPAVNAITHSRSISTANPSINHSINQSSTQSNTLKPSATQTLGRKSWGVRDMWVDREQQSIKVEEEKTKARIKQLTKALNLCRILQRGVNEPAYEFEEVELIVKRLKIHLDKLDVGHINTMENERLMLDSPYALLSVLQILSTPGLAKESVKSRLKQLRVSKEVEEYVLFFFPDHQSTNPKSESLLQQRRSLSLQTRSPATPNAPSRDVLTALTAFINRRQTEDRIRDDQLVEYAKSVAFDVESINVHDAETVLGRAHSIVQSDAAGKRVERASLPHLDSANQVVIALQMLYEDVSFDDAQVVEICTKAHMADDTVKYLLAKNKEKQKRLMDEDRARRRANRLAQRNERAAASSPQNNAGMTVRQLSDAINNRHLCLNWANDEEELKEVIKTTKVDLKSINTGMVNELADSQLRFSSLTQLGHTLHLLSAPDVSIQKIQHLCTETELPPAMVRHIVTARLKWELLEDDAVTIQEAEDERMTIEQRTRISRAKAQSVMQHELVEQDEPDEVIVERHVAPKPVSINELVDSLNHAQLVETSVVMTSFMVTQLLEQHPFPLSVVDLSEIHEMRQARLSFASPNQLFKALELLHSELDDDQVRIEAVKTDMSPSVVRYIMEHERPIHAQVSLSREDSQASRTKRKRLTGRRSLSMLHSVDPGQELIEEIIQTTNLTEFIAGKTNAQQLAEAIRQANILENPHSMNAQMIEHVAQELEFDPSVVDLEMIPILVSHTGPFQSLPQLLTALQLMYTDLSDDEIKVECESAQMDRKTIKFLVKNSFRKVLAQPEISAQLTDVGLSDPIEVSIQRQQDPRYARITHLDEGSAVAELVQIGPFTQASNRLNPQSSKKKRHSSFFTSTAQLTDVVNQLNLVASPARNRSNNQLSISVRDLGQALSFENIELDEIKLTDLARFAENGVQFSSAQELVATLQLIHSDMDEESIKFEAVRRQLPPAVCSHLMEFHEANHEENRMSINQPSISHSTKRQARSRHQARYISQDMALEDWGEALMHDAQMEKCRNTAVAVYAQIQSCESLLESGVSATQAEIETWINKLGIDPDRVTMEAVEIVQMQVQAGLEHKLMSVRDLLISIVDLGEQLEEVAEVEQLPVEKVYEAVKQRQRPLPVPPQTIKQSSTQPRVHPHTRSVSMPGSRRSSGNNHQSINPVVHLSTVMSSSPSPSPISTPSVNQSSRRVRGSHVRGAPSMSWNSGDKREHQLVQLRRLIAQNQLVVGTPLPQATTPQQSTEPPNDEPPPPMLLSQRRSLASVSMNQSFNQSPPTPTSNTSRFGHPTFGNSPVNGSKPPPLPSNFLNNQSNSLRISTAPPVPLSFEQLEQVYAWDTVTDPVESIHLVCDLIKWRTLNEPQMTWPSVAALFDFLCSPDWNAYEQEDGLDEMPTPVDPDHDTAAGVDASVLSVKSLASTLGGQLRMQAPNTNSQQRATPPPIPPSAFAPPPFSPTVALSINHPYAFPSIEAVNEARRRQLNSIETAQAQDQAAMSCCGPSLFGPKQRGPPDERIPQTQNNGGCTIL